ncbi:MAG: IS3 family transposase [Bacteroidia bacterium]|nr:IS3 family transposase [Bacteroidia bacterium]
MEVSHARACRLLGCSRKTKYYKHKMPIKDKRIKEIIQKAIGTTRKGRVKVIKQVQKDYPELGVSKIRRVYEREGFSLSKKLRRRIKDNPKNPIQLPLAKNEEWAIDFMSDSLNSGRRIRTLNVIDHFNRECKGIEIAINLPARRVIEYLDILIERHGTPKRIRTDNGPEFRSKLFQCWLTKNNIEWSRIRKGKPQENAIVERFNRTYREDVLDAYVFNTIEDAQEVTNGFIEEYNEIRPHQALNYQTPSSYVA